MGNAAVDTDQEQLHRVAVDDRSVVPDLEIEPPAELLVLGRGSQQADRLAEAQSSGLAIGAQPGGEVVAGVVGDAGDPEE